MLSLHFSPRSCRWLFGVVCLLPLAFAGCGDEVKLYPVTGKVTLGGTAMNVGTVKLWLEGGKDTDIIPAGPINSDGTYEIFTNGKKGAPLGKYKITVATGVPPGPGAVLTPSADPGKTVAVKMTDVPKIYTEKTSTTLKYEVVTEPNATQYDLSMAK